MTLLRPAFTILIALFARLQMPVRKRSHVNTKLVSTWRAARIFLLGDPISSVGAVSEPLRFLMI